MDAWKAGEALQAKGKRSLHCTDEFCVYILLLLLPQAVSTMVDDITCLVVKLKSPSVTSSIHSHNRARGKTGIGEMAAGAS